MMKNIILLLSILILKLVTGYTSYDEAKYYEKLIVREIQKSNAYQLPTDASQFRPRNRKPVYFGTYDFVIIGAGAAGSVIANRLSENSSWKVLLLETGKPGNDFANIPAMQNYIIKSGYNWGYITTPQRSCCLATNGVCAYPSGKGLGGSSILSSVTYSRGTRLDYKKWGDAGNKGWYYEDVLPYFKKSENSAVFGDNEYHSTGGYLNVEFHEPVSSKIPAFLKANIEIGKQIGDYDAEDAVVAGFYEQTSINGKRMTSEIAFLNPVKSRTNLEILTESYVTKIVITKLTKTASGVTFSYKNTNYMVNVVNEVILSAGAIGSPKILMQSGIGPSKHLENFGIPVIRNLDVGKRMNDRAFMQVLFNSTVHDPELDITTTIHQYLSGIGPMTSLEDVVSLHNEPYNRSAVPDFAVLLMLLKEYELSNSGLRARNRNGVFSMSCQVLHLKSMGRVYLKSDDPYQYPLIDTNCLAEHEDVINFLNAIQLIFKLLETEALNKFNIQLIPVESCKHYAIKSRQYWICVIRQNGSNGFHAGGTCRMGPDSEEGAVVDNKLKVHGVSKLRVADASVIPLTLSGETNAPAMMIGERAADFIKEEYESF